MLQSVLLKDDNELRCTFEHIGNLTACDYIKSNCDERYFKIAQTYHCSSYQGSIALTIGSSLILTSLIAFLIFILGLVVSNYLLHCVKNFTDILGLGRDLLSLIVIPLVNCLPDLISYHYAISSESIDLILGQAIGANLLTLTVIVGVISLTAPFIIADKMELLKEYTWVTVLLIILTCILSDSKVTIFECVAMTLVYFIHAYFSLQQNQEQHNQRKPQAGQEPSQLQFETTETTSLIEHGSDTECDENRQSRDYVRLICSFFDKIALFLDLVMFFLIPISKSTLSKIVNKEESIKRSIFRLPLYHLWLMSISVFLVNSTFLHFPDFVALAFTVPAHLTIELISQRTNEFVQAIFIDSVSIVNSMAIITQLTKALLQILKNLGLIWNISEYAMGLLAYSIVNSINDLIMNLLLSTTLDPSLGVKSCLGTSYLLILIGIGFNGFMTMLMRGVRDGHPFEQSLSISMSWELILSTMGLNFVVLLTIGYLVFFDWKFDRRLGLILITSWIVITSACITMDLGR